MSIAVDQRATLGTVNGGTTVNCQFNTKPTGGDTVIVLISAGNFSSNSALATGVVDAAGNTYTKRVSLEAASHGAAAEIWSCDSVAVPGGTWTVTPTWAAGTFGSVSAVSISSCLGFDASGTTSGTNPTTAWSTGANSSVAGDYFVGVMAVDSGSGAAGVASTSTSWVDQQAVQNGTVSECYLYADLTTYPTASLQTWTGTFSSPGTWDYVAVVACFKPSNPAPTGAGGPFPQIFAMNGPYNPRRLNFWQAYPAPAPMPNPAFVPSIRRPGDPWRPARHWEGIR